MKTRIELAAYFNELGFKRGAEIGVCAGRYSRVLCEQIPSLQLLAVDFYRDYENKNTIRHQDTQFENLKNARRKLRDYPNASILIADSITASQWVPDGSLDFVFIDSDHSYEAVRADIAAWAPKVRKGGIVSGHDYYLSRSGLVGVVKAVDEYAAVYGYQVQTTDWDETAYRDDKQPDWYWVVK